MKTLLLALLLGSALAADNLEKTQKKELENQVKAMAADAQRLAKAGQLAEARAMYAASQALIEMKDVADAIKHLDEEIHKRVKDSLSESRKLYDSHKFKEAAGALEEGMKLQAFQPVLAYDLALCYYQLGDRSKALEYIGKARAGTADPKHKQALLQAVTFFTTGENGTAANDNDKSRISQVNRLAESIGVEASLEDAEGSEDPEFQDDLSSSDPPKAQPVSLASQKSPLPSSSHSNANASRRSSLCNALGDLKGTLVNRPSGVFDLANCAESNGRAAEAVRLLEKYLEMSPSALDGDEVRTRIADLKAQLTLPGASGIEIRRLYASIYDSLAERRYDRALAELQKASALAPEFALTQ
jgi:tetratricopeptide (TPR) repeat protein